MLNREVWVYFGLTKEENVNRLMKVSKKWQAVVRHSALVLLKRFIYFSLKFPTLPFPPFPQSTRFLTNHTYCCIPLLLSRDRSISGSRLWLNTGELVVLIVGWWGSVVGFHDVGSHITWMVSSRYFSSRNLVSTGADNVGIGDSELGVRLWGLDNRLLGRRLIRIFYCRTVRWIRSSSCQNFWRWRSGFECQIVKCWVCA